MARSVPEKWNIVVDWSLHVTPIPNMIVAWASLGPWQPYGSDTQWQNPNIKTINTLKTVSNQIKSWLRALEKLRGEKEKDLPSKCYNSKEIFLALQDQNCQHNTLNSQLLEVIHLQYPVSTKGSTISSPVANGLGNHSETSQSLPPHNLPAQDELIGRDFLVQFIHVLSKFHVHSHLRRQERNLRSQKMDKNNEKQPLPTEEAHKVCTKGTKLLNCRSSNYLNIILCGRALQGA